MPDKILLEVEEYLEPEYTRATRIENIKLWLTVALGVSSLCLTINHIAAIYYTGVILFVVALILGIVLLVVLRYVKEIFSSEKHGSISC